MSPKSIRPALPTEAPRLTAIALRSKAHWGYDTAFMEACVAPLTVTAAIIESSPIFVAEEAGRVLGFYGLTDLGDDVDLAYMFVEPDFIGRGIGRSLWQHAIEMARVLGYCRLLVASDPYAERFYLAMGADRIGEEPSEVAEGRTLPLLAFPL